MIVRFGPYEIDSGRYELRRAGESVPIEPKALDLLLYLARERERLVTKQDLLDELWPGVHVTESTLTRAVSLARTAVGDSAQAQGVIETVSGRGYRWKAEVEVFEAAGAAAAGRTRGARAARLAIGLGAAVAAAAGLLALAWPRPLGWALALTGVAFPAEAPALPAEPSVVVLTFRDLDPDGGHALLAEGITEDLTSALVRFPALFVISRSSAASYRGRGVPLETIARELGVRYAVEGSVRAAGERIVVASQLVDATTGVQVWGDRFETGLDDALDLQGRLAEQIVAALGARIEEAELERLRRRSTDDFGAYELFVQARADFYTYTREGHARARELLARALSLDPDYPLAVSYQAGLELAPYFLGWDPAPERVERARELATRALALDPFSAFPRTTLAMAYMAEGRGAEALGEASRAVELGPNSDVCHGVQAAVLAETGRHLDALRALDRALRLNPRHPELYWLMAGLLQARGGRRDLAAELFERVRVANPDIVPPRLVLALHHHEGGDLERARELGREILRINPVLTAELALRILPFARGDRAQAEHALAGLRAAGLP